MIRKFSNLFGLLFFAGIVFLVLATPVLAANEGGCSSPTLDKETIPLSAEPTEITVTTSGDCFKMEDSYLVRFSNLPLIDGIRPETTNRLKFMFPGNQPPGNKDFGISSCRFGVGTLCGDAISADLTVKEFSAPVLAEDNKGKSYYRRNEEVPLIAKNLQAGTEYTIYWAQIGDDPTAKTFVAEKDGDLPETIVVPTNILEYESKQLCLKPTQIRAESAQPSCINVTVTTLPSINYEDQVTCSVKEGELITFTVSDLEPDKEYDWYYQGNGTLDSKDIVRSDKSASTATFEVPTTKALDDGEDVCVDFNGNISRSYPGLNCIHFEVTEDGTGAVDCRETNTTFRPTPTPAPPLPPCSAPTGVTGPDPRLTGCGAIYTGLGFAISTNPAEFISQLFTILLSLSGIILLILIIQSGYEMMTSQGNPEKIKEARERITSAIIGFIFLLFSLVILEVIGVDILHLPCFGDNASDPSCGIEKQAPLNTSEQLIKDLP